MERVVRVEKMRNVYRLLVRGLKGKRPVGRTGSKWVDNMDVMRGWRLDSFGSGSGLAPGFVNTAVNSRVIYMSGSFFTS